MSNVYRKTWTAANGHTYKLDIVPYDTATTAAVVNLSDADANLIEVGALTDEFDELPVGLAKPSSMTIRFVLNRLPTALQTYLRAKQNSTGIFDLDSGILVYPRNTFILATDGGAAEDTILFVGVQSKINSQTYTRANGEYIVEIECTDAVQYVMSNISPKQDTKRFAKMSAWSADFASGGLDESGYNLQLRRKQYAYELLRAAGAKRYASWYVSSKDTEYSYFNTWATTFNVISQTLAACVNDIALRNGGSGVDEFDKDGIWQSNDVTDVCTFLVAEQVDDTTTRGTGAGLSASQLYLLTNIVQDGNNVGGLSAETDKYGWGRYESYWDLFKDLSESMFLKAWYRYERGTGTDAGKIFTLWNIEPVMSAINVAIDVLDSLDEPEIIETEPAIGRAEVRYQAEYGEATVTQLVANAGAVRADRQFTVDTPMHNNPLFKPKRPGDIYELGMLHCNLFWFNDTNASAFGSDNIAKVHENLKIRWGSGAGQIFEYNESTISHNPPIDKELHQFWAASAQRVTGLPYALAHSYTAVFGQDALASVTLRLRLNDYRIVVGNRHTITGDITTDLPHLAWSNAVATSVETNVTEGTQTVRFMLIPNPA